MTHNINASTDSRLAHRQETLAKKAGAQKNKRFYPSKACAPLENSSIPLLDKRWDEWTEEERLTFLKVFFADLPNLQTQAMK